MIDDRLSCDGISSALLGSMLNAGMVSTTLLAPRKRAAISTPWTASKNNSHPTLLAFLVSCNFAEETLSYNLHHESTFIYYSCSAITCTTCARII